MHNDLLNRPIIFRISQFNLTFLCLFAISNHLDATMQVNDLTRSSAKITKTNTNPAVKFTITLEFHSFIIRWILHQSVLFLSIKHSANVYSWNKIFCIWCDVISISKYLFTSAVIWWMLWMTRTWNVCKISSEFTLSCCHHNTISTLSNGSYYVCWLFTVNKHEAYQ